MEAAEQLAIHYEHRAKEPRLALDLIRSAMTELQAARRAGTITKEYEARMRARFARRLDRLEHRCAAAPLFKRVPARSRLIGTTA